MKKYKYNRDSVSQLISHVTKMDYIGKGDVLDILEMLLALVDPSKRVNKHKEECKRCKGTGITKIASITGNGLQDCPCWKCNGTGKVSSTPLKEECKRCKGTGKISLSYQYPTKMLTDCPDCTPLKSKPEKKLPEIPDFDTEKMTDHEIGVEAMFLISEIIFYLSDKEEGDFCNQLKSYIEK